MTADVIDRLLAADVAPTVVSNLAEGADRLVAEIVLARAGSQLEVVLPMAAEDFVNDFEAEASRQQFIRLVQQAASVTVVAQVDGEPREAAYERAGQTMVDGCDVLVALWDGAPSRGRGGTAEIIQYALDRDILVEVVLVEREPR